MEVLVGVVAIDRAPRAGGSQGNRRFLVRQHGRRHVLFERGLRGRREVAHEAVGADLVLDLHHEDGVSCLVDLREMAHQRDERLLVGLQRLRAEGRQAVARLAVAVEHAREAPVVELDPFRRVRRACVLPGAEPQQHQVHLVLARLRQEGVDVAEIELALDRLDLFPRHRDLDRVGVDVLRRRPDLAECRRIVAGIVDLHAQHRERRAVDEQCRAAAFVHQVRQLRGRGMRARDACGRQRQRGEGNGEDLAHSRAHWILWKRPRAGGAAACGRRLARQCRHILESRAAGRRHGHRAHVRTCSAAGRCSSGPT